ncbi:MFS general substrate transporter [Trematosphaeria pertusa]|uniref:MFS general substrate transporter n=1 Tax=Trematosphaeria pertusa TaxID=390896 RepID=A0A6A6HYS5_9PLEO|nr:MFS general substrate transporter [Trematosphaeria pertusa]KAF2243049.1 MFS general substrate transporter [Trematosphaeria pertusa]
MASERTTELELARYPGQTPSHISTDIEPQHSDPSDDIAGFSLPPTDGGKDAWLFLLACFMLEGLIWGFAASYGIFQEYYSTREPFAGSSNIPLVGACAMGIMYMDITIMFALLKYFPKLRAWATPIGLVIMCLALGLGSLSTNVTHLILTQGIIYAVGGGLAWTPILFYIEEWWVRRRGFAYGATMAGLGLSGAILPIVLEWLLNRYGFRTTLRVCALSFVALNFPLLFFFKPRLPLSQTSQSRSFDMSFWKCTNFLILQSGNVIQSLGYFLPAIYLPTYARSLGASGLESTVTLILLNAAAFVGSLCMGTAVDKYDVVDCLFVSALGSTIGVFLLWGLATSLAPLYIFSLAYGAFAGCNSSSWSAIIRDTRDKKRGADSGMIFACLSAGKGIANLCSGPLSEALVEAGSWRAGMAYGSGYGALIVFTGATALLSGWSFAAKRVGWL